MGYFRVRILWNRYDLARLDNFQLGLAGTHGDPQSESVTEFPLLSSYKRLESIRCSFRNVKRFQKSFWFFSWRNVWAWAHYKFAMLLTPRKFLPRLLGTVSNGLNAWQSEILKFKFWEAPLSLQRDAKARYQNLNKKKDCVAGILDSYKTVVVTQRFEALRDDNRNVYKLRCNVNY